MLLSLQCLVEMRKALKTYSLPFTQACMLLLLHPETVGESCKIAWNSSESSILIRTAQNQNRVSKLVMHWRQCFQECRNPLCCVSSQPKPSSRAALLYWLLTFTTTACGSAVSMARQSLCLGNILKCFVTQPLSYYFYCIILPVLQLIIFLF